MLLLQMTKEKDLVVFIHNAQKLVIQNTTDGQKGWTDFQFLSLFTKKYGS